MKFTSVGCIALILWASSIPFAKRCAEDVGPLTVTAMQYLIGGILGLATNLTLGKLRSSELGFLKNRVFYFRTALFAAYSGLLYFAIGAVTRHELPVVTLLNYIWPTATMVLSVWLLGQKCNRLLLAIGSLIALAGLTIEIVGAQIFDIFTQTQSISSIVAFIAAAGAGLTWGFYTVLNRMWGNAAGGVIGLPLVMLGASIVLFCLRFAFQEQSRFPPEVLLPLTYMMIMPYIANLCWDVGTRKGSITVLSLLADGLPWASLTIASLYLSIAIDSKTWISAAVIVSGALISRYSLTGSTLTPSKNK